MRIVGIELREVALPLREPFASSAETRTTRRILLLRLLGASGASGWGECVAGETPAYAPETTETAWHLLTEFLLPGALDREGGEPEDLLRSLGWVKGNPMARATVEMAAWDLRAREEGIPLHTRLGGTGDGLSSAIVLGLGEDPSALLAPIAKAVEEGYALVKLKVAPGRDHDLLAAVRERFPDLPLAVDANGAYAGESLERLLPFDRWELAFFEQPLAPEDLAGHAALQSSLRTPICLDESVSSLPALARALEQGAGRMVSIKPGCLGGLSAARDAHDLCRAHGIPARVGGMLESGVGRGHNVALATLPGFSIPGDLSESRRYWLRDLVHPEWCLSGGRILPPRESGIGVTVDEEAVEAATVRRATFGVLRQG